MLVKMIKSIAHLRRSQEGMTGLETALILIAFSTVAAVFSYAVLSSGIFSAERGKETIYAGLQQAKANMEVSGSVIVKSDNVTDKATYIIFSVRNAIAGTPIDMTPPGGTGANRCIVSLATGSAYYSNIAWEAEYAGHHDSDNLLDAGEQLEIEIDLTSLHDANGADLTPQPDLGPNDWFNIQVKPVLGSTMTIQRTLPAGLDTLMDLH
jgi:flagellin FlaB